MQRFINELGNCDIKNFEVVRISNHDNERILNLTLKSLKLNTINELRDRFEGMAFYRKFQTKISGLIALERILDTKLINWNKVNPIDFESVIIVNGQTIELVVCDFGNMPELENIPDHPIILFILKEEMVLWLVGFQDSIAYREVITGGINSRCFQIVQLSEFSHFNDFKTLRHLL